MGWWRWENVVGTFDPLFRAFLRAFVLSSFSSFSFSGKVCFRRADLDHTRDEKGMIEINPADFGMALKRVQTD